jgi:hypothetical protein
MRGTTGCSHSDKKKKKRNGDIMKELQTPYMQTEPGPKWKQFVLRMSTDRITNKS